MSTLGLVGGIEGKATRPHRANGVVPVSDPAARVCACIPTTPRGDGEEAHATRASSHFPLLWERAPCGKMRLF